MLVETIKDALNRHDSLLAKLAEAQREKDAKLAPLIDLRRQLEEDRRKRDEETIEARQLRNESAIHAIERPFAEELAALERRLKETAITEVKSFGVFAARLRATLNDPQLRPAVLTQVNSVTGESRTLNTDVFIARSRVATLLAASERAVVHELWRLPLKEQRERMAAIRAELVELARGDSALEAALL
jgi:hypothetical protein